MAGKRWTRARRAAQAEAIRRWQPWGKSTGPRTSEGKARASQNGIKHGLRSKVVAQFRALDRQYRHGSQDDLALLEQVEAAREAACEFVAERSRADDVPARIEAYAFIERQARLARKRMDKIMEPLVRRAKGR